MAEIKEEYLTFLDELMESGAVNMFGATPFIIETFGVSREDAKEILVHWMNTFSERHK